MHLLPFLELVFFSDSKHLITCCSFIENFLSFLNLVSENIYLFYLLNKLGLNIAMFFYILTIKVFIQVSIQF